MPASYNDDQKDVMEYGGPYGWSLLSGRLPCPFCLRGRETVAAVRRAVTLMPWCGYEGYPALSVPIRADFCPFEAEITDLAEPGSSLLLLHA